MLRLRRAHYDRVYDLQNDSGTNLIFQALRPLPPDWSGAAAGASLPHRNRNRGKMHLLERQAEQLQDAGIWPDAPVRPLSAPPPDISWILAGSARQRAPSVAAGQRPLVVMAPGGADVEARWPIDRYADLARKLQDSGFDVVVVGALGEAALAHQIQRKAARARDLTGRTDFAQIAALGARAALAVGNDIGVLHLVAAAGAPTLALYSSANDPAISAPRGLVTVLHAPALNDLAVDTVARAAQGFAQAPS
jgi:ADP-heptose:LPS heptosyltransferase